jgi:hypothetical protein
MGLTNTQSKFIAAARVKCSFHRENGPASNGNRLYRIIVTADYSTVGNKGPCREAPTQAALAGGRKMGGAWA